MEAVLCSRQLCYFDVPPPTPTQPETDLKSQVSANWRYLSGTSWAKNIINDSLAEDAVPCERFCAKFAANWGKYREYGYQDNTTRRFRKCIRLRIYRASHNGQTQHSESARVLPRGQDYSVGRRCNAPVTRTLSMTNRIDTSGKLLRFYSG
jgi:hypothetical protein